MSDVYVDREGNSFPGDKGGLKKSLDAEAGAVYKEIFKLRDVLEKLQNSRGVLYAKTSVVSNQAADSPSEAAHDLRTGVTLADDLHELVDGFTCLLRDLNDISDRINI